MTKSVAPSVFVPSINNVAFASSIVQTLDGLAAMRKTWESTDFKKANDGLYALLAQCLETFENKFVNASESDRKTLRSELTTLLQAAGVKVQKNTTTLNMFVRYVFGSDRKRAHGYAYVLTAALSHKKTAAELPAWIADCGGIEEIKRLMIKSEESKAKAARLESAHNIVKSDVEQAILSPMATLELSLSGNYAVLLAKPNPDGTTSIIGALSEVTEGLLNDLLLRMARQRLDSNDKGTQVNNEAQDLLSGSVNSVDQVAFAA